MTVVVEAVRNLPQAGVLTSGVAGGGLGVAGALLASVVVRVGFPVVLLSGSDLHERVRPQLAVIHAVDWLIKLLAMTSIIAAVAVRCRPRVGRPWKSHGARFGDQDLRTSGAGRGG